MIQWEPQYLGHGKGINSPSTLLPTWALPSPATQVGDCFLVNYNNKNYEIEVREAKPGNAISVVETDCQVSGPW